MLYEVITENESVAASFLADFRAYVARFGDRGMEELKLETVTPAQDPSQLLTLIRTYTKSGHIDPAAAWERERQISYNFV